MMEWLSWLTSEYDDQLEILLRLVVATVAGMVIGLNRDIHNKAMGMRTLGLVSLGSALVVMAGSAYEDTEFAQDAASRVVQGVLTGLGFLGAGAILRGKDGTEVQGLTTASTVWVSAAIGVSTGLGAWFITLTGTAIVLFLLIPGKPLEENLARFFAGREKSDGGLEGQAQREDGDGRHGKP